MALQGTIDTFPLTDVLALLASSSRSGRLKLTGDRGTGTVWLHDEAVLGGELEDGRFVGPDRIVFELLRFEDGSFEFQAIDRSEFPGFEAGSKGLGECVGTAKGMLEQWGAIEVLVPSVGHRVDLAPELPSEEFTVDQGLWRVLVTVSRCSSVAEIAADLGVDDYEGSALVASMVEAGLVEVNEPWDIEDVLGQMAELDSSGTDQDGTEVHEEVSSGLSLIDELTGSTGGRDQEQQNFPDHFPIDDLITEDEVEMDDPWSSPAMEKLEEQRRSDAEAEGQSNGLWAIDSIPFDTVALDPTAGDTSAGDPVNGSNFDGWDELVGTHGEEIDLGADSATEEVLRQMSKLSPKAAEAIAAALGNVESATERAEEHVSADGPADSGTSESSPISFLDSF